jgi:hypothetical protein
MPFICAELRKKKMKNKSDPSGEPVSTVVFTGRRTQCCTWIISFPNGVSRATFLGVGTESQLSSAPNIKAPGNNRHIAGTRRAIYLVLIFAVGVLFIAAAIAQSV